MDPLQRLEGEMEENNLLQRKAITNRKVVTPTSRGRRAEEFNFLS